MKLGKIRLSSLPLFLVPFLALAFVNPVAAAAPIQNLTTHKVLHVSTVTPVVALTPSGYSPNTVGGVPFCPSGSLGTILCYPASFLKTAYGFPSNLNGAGSTIVIVDAFGSPTAQADLNTYDKTFGLPGAHVTILCGPSWTGAPWDHCPVNTLRDITTVGNTEAGTACGGPGGVAGWAEETTLDLSQAHSLAPAAKIVLVVANDCFDSSIYTAEQAVVNQAKYAGSIMSQSFGEPDDLVTCLAVNAQNVCTSRDPTLLNLPNQVFQTAQRNHWTVIASSGDDGANEDARVLGTYELTPSFPATSNLVLAAGGTQGDAYGGQFGPPPGTLFASFPSENCLSNDANCQPFTCPANTNCNTGLVVVNGGENGCTTSTRPGVPSSCKPVGYGGEGAWNEVNYLLEIGTSSGGGISSLYARPDYQGATPDQVTTQLEVTTPITGRTTPDVSFNSAINGGVLAFLGFITPSGAICTEYPCAGDWAVFGGTSASSPAWAAIVALLDQAHHGSVGFLNPAIYRLGQASLTSERLARSFHDITSGCNSDFGVYASYYAADGFCSAPGYDLATGWGTPNVSAFIQNVMQFLGPVRER